jgi:predicted DNA-binding protein (UPF0251 family)/predicted Fe-Mo cluster-binding NifX family protein
MPRPFKCRMVAFMPGVTYFKPAGVPLRYLEEVAVTVEEMEALRLRELEGLEQEQAAAKMEISRPTFQRILASARRKIADALLNGKAIRIEGGNYEFITPTEIAEQRKKEKLMKIAAISDDGIMMSQHFGMASLYVVFTVENGKVVKKETRNKMGHQHFAAGPHAGHGHGPGHGFDPGSQSKHDQMAQNIDDCQVLIVGGMGYGAYESMKSRGLEAVITDISNIDEAVKLYIDGKLPNLMEKLH